MMKNSIIILLISVFFGSCIPQKKILYVQDTKESKDTIVLNHSVLTIKPKDELFVSIASLSGVNSANMNPLNESGGPLAQSDISLVSYTVNYDGNIKLPIIGYIYVKDKTVEEISIELEDTLQTYMDEPFVSVKLLNKNITVLGEVMVPGHYQFSGEKLSIFSALGRAGDIATYGNRKKIMVMRETKEGMVKHRIDLTDEMSLSSNLFYLQPNDIIYVPPLRSKFWGMRVTPFTIILSSITTYFIYMGLTADSQ